MRSVISRRGSIAAVLISSAGTVLAQDATRIDVEISYDEVQWVSQLAFVPGDTIHVRVRVTKEGPSTVLGLGTLTFQPTVSPWPVGSTVLPFTYPTTGQGVPDQPGLRGRILPFATSGMGMGSASGILTWHVDDPGVLRFAGANATTIASQWGVATGQVPPSISTNFNSNTSVVVFKTAVQINPQTAGVEHVFDVPLAGIVQARASWYRHPVGASSLVTTVTQADIHPARAYIGGNPCIFAPIFTSQPVPIERASGQTAAFDAVVSLGICQPTSVRWYHGSTPLNDGSRITGAATTNLRVASIESSDAGTYRLLASNTVGSTWSNSATLGVRCTADVDDGTGSGTPDGGVTIDDLLYYLVLFEQGAMRADVDDGSGTGTPDGGVTIDDLLFYLMRFELGC